MPPNINHNLDNVSEHIKELGLGMLAQAQRNLLTGTWDVLHFPQINCQIFGILQAAHAAELLIKAAISERHPLLIFTKLPESSNVDLLDYQSLALKGKTVEYNALPQLLWAVTSYKIEKLDCYREFGILRNAIQHFAVPEENLEKRGAQFMYQVIDPIISHFWGLNAIEFNDTCDAEAHLLQQLRNLNIRYRLPEGWDEFEAEALESL